MSTIRALLAHGRDALVAAEVDTPMLDAAVLLAHAMGSTKERLLASLPDEADEDLARRYDGMLDERRAGRPVSYIRRLKEFWGLEFHVDEAVLVPRPDTETLVDRALFLARADAGLVRIHDACTGSGCVAIALAAELAGRVVTASDISDGAERVFELNCARLLGRQLPFFRSDLLAATPGPYDLLTANPPYLTDREADDLAKIGWPEPDLALRGGPDGTAVVGQLIREAVGRIRAGGWICLEAAAPQLNRLAALLDQAGFRAVEIEQDLGGRDRVISGRLG
ncbi:MAG: peptide chain release factor N(5)-glutamine methyltransferase [Spirochaetes bacterium]|nr:peptide chain release factor N(5)-glutamine methyltransferase [Spirochaetota bacterium]